MSSSNSTLFLSFDSEQDDENRRGFPKTCRCGGRVVIRTSKTPKNPGRLFHTCENKSEIGGIHTWKWTDEALVEEVQDIKTSMCNREKFQDEEMELLKAQIRVCEEVIEDLRGEAKRMKLIVAGFVVLGCYLFFYN